MSPPIRAKEVVTPLLKPSSFTITIDGVAISVYEVDAKGDVLLDVTFHNKSCNKSFPAAMLRELRTNSQPLESTRILYRVCIATLKKHSKYFAHLLASTTFGEGLAVSKHLDQIKEQGKYASELPASDLARIAIEDDDDATLTLGRESIFLDLLRIMHGIEHASTNINILYLAVLAIMGDQYDCILLISRYMTKSFRKFRYPATFDASVAHESTLRQKILVFWYTQNAPLFLAATKELILRGSRRWLLCAKSTLEGAVAWNNLPHGLEAELLHRRKRICFTIASMQESLLEIYTSRTQQCTFGYSSSPACDSFQLGEMVKFFVRKNLMTMSAYTPSLVDTSSDYGDEEATCDAAGHTTVSTAYSGDIEQVIATLRQCPGYQLDAHHHHCGLRSKILPPLNFIHDAIHNGAGIRLVRFQEDREATSWQTHSHKTSQIKSWTKAKSVEEEDSTPRTFRWPADARAVEAAGAMFGWEQCAKRLFTAVVWDWTGGVSSSSSLHHAAQETRLGAGNPSRKALKHEELDDALGVRNPVFRF